MNLPKPTPGFVSRGGAEGELSFDPDTLEPRRPTGKPTGKTGPTEAAAPAVPAPPPPSTPSVQAEQTASEEAQNGEVGTEATEHRKRRKKRKKATSAEVEPEAETVAEVIELKCLEGDNDRRKPPIADGHAHQLQHNELSRM